MKDSERRRGRILVIMAVTPVQFSLAESISDVLLVSTKY